MSMQFKDKIVIITGGAHGIGKTTKEAFESEGATVEVTIQSTKDLMQNK